MTATHFTSKKPCQTAMSSFVSWYDEDKAFFAFCPESDNEKALSPCYRVDDYDLRHLLHTFEDFTPLLAVQNAISYLEEHGEYICDLSAKQYEELLIVANHPPKATQNAELEFIPMFDNENTLEMWI